MYCSEGLGFESQLDPRFFSVALSQHKSQIILEIALSAINNAFGVHSDGV